MRVVSFIFFLIIASNADNIVKERCSDSSESSLTFEPSKDGVEGRYTVEWCTEADKNVTKWELVLRYIESRAQKKCQNYSAGFPIGQPHSRLELPITIDLNCLHVCFSTFLDLIFNGTCYHIKTLLRRNTTAGSSYNSLYYVVNNYTKDHFTNSKAVISIENYEGGVELHWYLGFIPATDYSVNIWDHQMEGSAEAACSAGGALQSEVTCRAPLGAAACYSARLAHRAPWLAAPSLFGHLANIDHSFCLAERAPPVVSSDGGWWRAGCSLAAALVAAALLLWTVRRRLVAVWKRRVREHWLSSVVTTPAKAPVTPGAILLLFARDCELLEAAAERLKELLQCSTGCQVYDLYSSSSVRLWARAGEEWLRLMLAGADTRVVVLSTPAGELLAAELRAARQGPVVAAPLLGSMCVNARPHAGDALLPLALRLLSAQHGDRSYRRHFVASIADLEADMVPAVTPLRRYVLPAATAALLRDLSPADEGAESPESAESAECMRQFAEALQAFTDYVRSRPDYLAERLIFK